jgi:ribosomal protein L11 methyltransferase
MPCPARSGRERHGVKMHKITLPVSDAATAESAAAQLNSPLLPQALAVTWFEAPPAGYVVEAYYEEAAGLAAVEQAFAGRQLGRPAVHPVPDQNWVELSQASLPPIAAGRFVVHGSHDRGRFALRRHAIEIDAGEAFGTGYNATTTLCLEAIDLLARQRVFGRIADIGCGTGVLAIAAARAWPAARVVALDNDPIAVGIARDNVQANRLRSRIRVVHTNGLDLPSLRREGACDLVLANILPNPLMEMAPAIRRLLMPGGFVVLSGLLSHQVREVAATYRAVGFRLDRRTNDDNWGALMLVRAARR